MWVNTQINSSKIFLSFLISFLFLSCHKTAPDPNDFPRNKMITFKLFPENEKDRNNFLYLFPTENSSIYSIYYYYYDVYGVKGTYTKISNHEVRVVFNWNLVVFDFKFDFSRKTYERYGDMKFEKGKFKVFYDKIEYYNKEDE